MSFEADRVATAAVPVSVVLPTTDEDEHQDTALSLGVALIDQRQRVVALADVPELALFVELDERQV